MNGKELAYKQDVPVATSSIITGTYTGNGSTSWRVILNSGVSLKVLIIEDEEGNRNQDGDWDYNSTGGLILSGQPLKSGGTSIAEITSTGFRIKSTSDDGCVNSNNVKYRYVGFY